MKKLISIVAILSLVFLPVTPGALAYDTIFNNFEGNNDWMDAGNWTNGVPPGNDTLDIEITEDVALIGGGPGATSVNSAVFSGAVWDAWMAGLTLTVAETATFNENSANLGQINGDAIFAGNAENQGTVTGDATFSGTSFNGNIVDGNATFNDNSYLGARVTGNATFNNNASATNSEIDGNVTFNGNSYGDLAFIGGNAVMNTTYYNGLNQTGNTFVVGTGKSWANQVTGTVYDSTGSTEITHYIFNGTANVNGVIVVGNATMNDTAVNGGDIHGNAIFNSQSQNWGNVTNYAFFGPAAANSGTTVPVKTCNFQGRADFLNETDDVQFTVGTGESWTEDTSGWTYTAETGGDLTWVFNNNSDNLGTLMGNAVFNGASINDGDIMGDAEFNGTSQNRFFITGNAEFNGDSINDGFITGDAEFNDSSYIAENPLTIGGDMVIRSDWYSGSAPVGNELVIANGRYWSGSVEGTVYDSSVVPVAITQYTFNGDSHASYGTVNGNATFNDTSYNDATVTGDAEFNGTTFNQSIVAGNATFNGNSFNYWVAQVDGNAIFNDTSTHEGEVDGYAFFGPDATNDGAFGTEYHFQGTGEFVNGTDDVKFTLETGETWTEDTSGWTYTAETGGDLTWVFNGTANGTGGNINGDVTFNSTGPVTVSTVISGAGHTVTMSGAGVVTLSGANTYTGGTTINAGTLQIGNGGITGSVVGDIVNDAELIFNRSNDLTYAGAMTGTGNLTKLGAGTLTLEGISGYSGTTTISAGVLKIMDTSSLGSSVVTVGSGATLELGDYVGPEFNLNSLTINGDGVWDDGEGAYRGALTCAVDGKNTTMSNDIVLGSASRISNDSYALVLSGNISASEAGTALTIGNGASADVQFDGEIGNTIGALTNEGTYLVLNNSNSYTGITTVAAGAIWVQNDGALGATGAGAGTVVEDGTSVILNSNGGPSLTITGESLTLNGLGFDVYAALHNYDGDNTWAGDITLGSGSTVGSEGGSLTISGIISGEGRALTLNAGTTILSGANTYSGATTVDGTLVLGNNLALQNSALNTDGAGVVDVTGFTTPTLGGLTGSVDLASVITTGYDGVTALTLNPGTGVTNTYSGAIAEGAAGMTLTKTGVGTQVLSGANTYAGDTMVSAGTLALSHASANNISGSTAVTVASGAELDVTGLAAGAGMTLASGQTLSGGGTVTGDLTVGSNSTLSPGASPGTLSTVGDVTFAAGGTYTWEINDATGTVGTDPGWDLHDITGGLTITSGVGTEFTIAITSLTLGNVAGNAANFNKFSDYTWVIASTTTGITGFDALDFTLDASAFSNSVTGTVSNGIFGIEVSGTDLQLTYTAAVNTPPNPIYWKGDTSGAWNLHAGDGTTNWVDGTGAEADAVPDATSDVHFYYTGAGNLTTTLGEDFEITTLTMDAGTNAVVIGGNTLTLNSSGDAITLGATSGALTINSAVVLGDSQSWVNDSANTLTVGGTVTNGGNTLTVTGSGDTDISGAIGGTGGLTKTGDGTLELSGAGANTYSGLTTVSAGELALNKTGVTAVAGNLTVNGTGTATLVQANQIADGSTVTVSASGATLDMGANNDTVSVFNMSAGELAGTGTLTATTYGLSGGTVTANLGTGTMNVTGSTALDGTSAATAVNISAGTLGLGSSDRLADAGTVTLSGTGILNMGAFDDTVGAFNMSAGSLNGTGTLTAATCGLTGGTVNAKLGAGAVTVDTGTVTLGSAGRLNAAADVTIQGGELALGGAESVNSLTLMGGTISGAHALTSATDIDARAGAIEAALQGAAGLTKSGAGTVTLSGANTYTGATTIGAGTLNANSSAALGDGSATNTLIFTGGTLQAGGTIISAATRAVTLTSTGLIDTNGNSVSIAGTMSGAGGVTKSGAGTLTLTGANDYTGTTTISGGTIVAGSASALGDGNVANNAALDVGLIGLNIGGTYIQGGAGTLRLTANSGSEYGSLTSVGGSVAGGIYVTVGGYLANNTVLDIIAGTGGYTVLDVNIVSSNSNYSFTGSEAGGVVSLVVNRAENGFASDAGGNSNSAAVGGVLDNIPGASGDMLFVLDTLDGMSAGAVGNALGTMTPDVSSGTAEGSRAMTGNSFSMISNRLGGARNGVSTSGISSGEVTEGTGVWMQGLGSHMKQKERKGIEGFTANTWGTTIGIDKLIDRHFRAGLAGSYGWARVKAKTPGSPSDDINSYQATVYGSFDSLDLCKARQGGRKSYEAVRSQVEDSWYVDGMLSFTQNNYDSRREIWLTPTNKRVAKADHYAQQYSTNFEAGYKFVFEETKDLEVTPFAGLGYNYLYMNSYKEKGADALNLHVQGDGFHQLEQTLGMKLAYPIVAKKMGTFIPSAKAAWLYDYIGDRFETTANFAGGGASFNTVGAKPAKSGMLLGAELAFLNKGNVTVTGNWDIELKDQFMSNTYYGTVRYDF